MKRIVRRVASRLGYRIEGIRGVPRQLLVNENLREVEFDDVICRRMFETGPSLSFLQIGAFDGVTKDPLHRYIAHCGWRGILVEPQPGAAHALRTLYARNDRVQVLEAAVDDRDGTRTMFVVNSDAVPDWAVGLASFDRTSILKHRHLVPGLEQMIGEVTVECVSFDRVLALLPPGAFDVLQIDAEGADADLLFQFPFHRVRPAIVHWEVKHADKRTREACFDRLVGVGYRLAPSGQEDMMAVLA